MRKITTRERLRYEFDNLMSRGPVALIGWLFLISLLLVVLSALLLLLTGVAPADEEGARPGLLGLLWMSLMHAMDPSAVAGDVGSAAFLLSMFGVSLGGIFIVSMLIGVLTSGMQTRIENLRRGRSLVVERGHTVILGWSPHIFSIISELTIANANRPRACIAILANREKIEMDEEIQSKVGDTGRLRVVCRCGNPVDMADLEVVNPHAARSIIILGEEHSPNPDSGVIKAILALTNHPQRRPEPYHIVAEPRDPRNLEIARMVGRDEAELVLVGDLIARITVQTSQQSGLSVVYTEFLDFGGNELYFQGEPALVGRTFGEALLAYEDSALVGLRARDGRVRLNPPHETRIQDGDHVIAISGDDDTVRLSGVDAPPVDESAIVDAPRRPPVPSRTLILGWNQRGPTIVQELNRYVAPGSALTVVADDPAVGRQLEGVSVASDGQVVEFRLGDTTDRRTLDALNVPGYEHIIVLSYSDALDVQEADSRTLITLLHLRDIADHADHSFTIVSEMLDVRNRDLAEITRADDFIVSDRIIGLMLSQVAEQKDLAAVFADLFDAGGSEIYLKPAGDYVDTSRPVNFYTVVEAARRRGEVAVGYRLAAQATDASRSYGVVLNPRKSEAVSFAPRDTVILLAES